MIEDPILRGRAAGLLRHRPRARSTAALLAAVAAVSALSMLAEPRAADAQEPDLMQTLIAEDVTLNNNLMPFAPTWDRGREGRALSFGFGVEKQLSERFGITIESEWDSRSPRRGRESAGFGSLDIALKYVLLKLPEQGFAFALTPSISLPTNSHLGGESMHVAAGTSLAWGGRLNRLPNRGWTRYLRPLEIQGDVAYSRTFDSRGSGSFFFDPVLDYSMPYLNYASGGSVPWWLRYFCPFIELNLRQAVGSEEYRPSESFLMPGLALLAQRYQVSLGTQVALNHEAARDQQVAIVASLLIFLDAIDPRFGWTPF
jgi:hypothetical protein